MESLNLNGKTDRKIGGIQKLNLNDKTDKKIGRIQKSLLVLAGGLLLLTLFIIFPLYFTVIFESAYGYIVGLVVSFVLFYSIGAWFGRSNNKGSN
nr:hypothetical protein [uncultured Methanomethylovorans sp.]